VHPLLRAALLACPSEFRRRFGSQIAADGTGYHGFALLAACWNVLLAGLTMWFENIARDLGFAIRSLAKAPAYTAVAILAFALAIGANVAVASVLDAVLLQPLPFSNADRLVLISQGNTLQEQISYANARDVEQRSKTLVGVGLSRENATTLTGRGKPQFLDGWVVDATYFDVLGANAQLGRLLGARDLGTSHIVITDDLWHRYFIANPHVLGKVLRLDNRDFTIVGVAPRGFRDPVPGGLVTRSYWSAVDPHSILARSRLWTGFHGIARLAPGVSVAAAHADISRVLADNARKYPSDFVGAQGSAVVPFLQGIVGSTQTLLWLLYAAVGMVLLIACVNIANLTLARIAARERELVVRSALGAARRRIVAQLTTELAVLAIAGGAAGVGLAYGLLVALRAVFAQLLPRWENVALNGHVLLYALLLVVVTVALTGLLPAFTNRDDMTLALKTAGRSGDRGVGRALRNALVVAEIALAAAVVVSAGLVLRSFISLTHVDVGFEPRDLSLLAISLPNERRYNDPNSAIAFSHRSLAALRAIPGVTGVAAAAVAPFGFNTYPRAFTIPGRPDPNATVTTNPISSGFFHTMSTPLLRGRGVTNSDTAHSAPVAVVNAAFARRYFGSIDAVGKQVTLTPFTSTRAVPMTIVGVAGDTRSSLSRPPEPQFYVPFDQLPIPLLYVVRTSAPNIPLRAAIDTAFSRIDPLIAPPGMRSYDTLLAQDAIRSEAATLLFGVLATLALILSLAGIYAVTAYSVEQRTREFGIRQAVGARAADVMRDVLRSALIQTAAGIAGGIILAAMFTRLLAGLLFQTSPLDPLTFTGVVALMLLAVVAAAAIPALRAARIQPASAIRYE